MDESRSTLRLVVSNPPSTRREEHRRADAILRRLVLASDDEGYEAAFKEFIRWASEPDLKVMK